jgi:hypothetical protein
MDIRLVLNFYDTASFYFPWFLKFSFDMYLQSLYNLASTGSCE